MRALVEGGDRGTSFQDPMLAPTINPLADDVPESFDWQWYEDNAWVLQSTFLCTSLVQVEVQTTQVIGLKYENI